LKGVSFFVVVLIMSVPYGLQRDDWATKRRFATEIASGMALVHSLGRIHRDLKSGNVLATVHQGRVTLKVADFGTVTLANQCQKDAAYVAIAHSAPLSDASSLRARTQLTKGIGTPLWMAPEILAGSTYGPSADVYSYAIVLWEIAAQSEVWPDVDGTFLGDMLLKLIDAGERPAVDSSWPSYFTSLMRDCWPRDPEKRLTFSQILAILKGLPASE
jgi:LRR receptor-like serine/threonine-protein kinase FLS2